MSKAVGTVVGMMVALLVLVSGPTALAGPRMRDFDRIGASVKSVYLPEAGATAEVALGESLVSSYNAYSLEVLRLKDPVHVIGKGYKLTIPQGVLPLVGKNDDGKFYESREPIDLKTFGFTQETTPGGIFIPDDPAITPETYWGGSINVVVAPSPDIHYDIAARDSTDPSAFRMELLYSGVVQNMLTLTYREFKDDMARPAFTQDLKYDLSQGAEIGFRTARFRVLKTTNIGLTYQVLSPLTR
ncbi:MAG: hypothetical protein JWM33_1596 [Caulobacteraceae bacterium]|nr:hypothetical protein [Caulobacteraceae bacterium]